LQRAAALRAGGEDRPPVAADVDEAAQHPVAVERDDDRHRAGGRREVTAGTLQLAEMTGVLPRPAEDPPGLEREDRRV